MNDQSFSLEPFSTPAKKQATDSSLPNIEIAGKISRYCNTLSIHYKLFGCLAELEISEPTDTPTRKHELWQQTCLEFFLGIKNSPRYWEFNLSPAGHWNVYRFKDYRQGMQEETAFTSLPFSVHNQPNSLSLTLELDLDQIVQVDQALEVAISAVIKPKDGEVTYWALAHWGAQADFHLRDSFIIRL